MPFHASDFFPGYGDFKNYELGLPAKRELYDRLLRIMQRHVCASAYSVVLYEPWERFVRGDAKKKNEVYTMCALGLVSRLYRWAQSRGETLAYVFERNKKAGQGKAFKAIAQLGENDGAKFLIGPVTSSPKGLPSLDAADIWCNELRRYVDQVLAGNAPKLTRAMEHLTRIPQFCGYVFGEAELATYLNFIVENRHKKITLEAPLQALPIPFVKGQGKAR